MVTVLGCKTPQKWGYPGSNPNGVNFMTWTQSQRQVFGSVGGGGGGLGATASVCGAFFFHVHGKTVHFLNIQEALIGSTHHTRIEGQRQMQKHALFLQHIQCVLKDRGQLHNLTIFVDFLFPFLFVVLSLLL